MKQFMMKHFGRNSMENTITKEDIQKENELIRIGLEKAYEKLVKFKKEKNSPLVVSENGKIVFITPDKIPLKANYTK